MHHAQNSNYFTPEKKKQQIQPNAHSNHDAVRRYVVDESSYQSPRQSHFKSAQSNSNHKYTFDSRGSPVWNDEESKRPYSPDEEHIRNAPKKNRKNMPAYLVEARENIEIPPFTLGGHDISGVDDLAATCDATNRCSSSSSHENRFDMNGSGFGGLSNFSAISDVSLSNGSTSPKDNGRRMTNPAFVGEQSPRAFMDIGSLCKGVSIMPSIKMLRWVFQNLNSLFLDQTLISAWPWRIGR